MHQWATEGIRIWTRPLQDPKLPLSNLYSWLGFHLFFFFSLSPKIPKAWGWAIASKKHHGDHSLLLGNVRGLPPILCTSAKGRKGLDTHGAP